ncbi:hypothetical protein [Bergeriella denitrificans]|uniref:Lipoprotein n=1 Tax=Bergeriella denitrificans TaxID=494 RepID=A0A378UDL2_BERDE|nr:hypothetical protein [Bergeriella denitrificans]STZ75456.1 Uncharacterised protein [Bergeriella denitrificans]
MDTVNEMFQRLRGVTRLRFESCSLPGSQMGWNCSGRGRTDTDFSDGILTFSDRFSLDNGRACRDDKQWRPEEGGLGFYRLRHQVFERIFLFRPVDGKLAAERPYLCAPDDYDGSLEWQGSGIVLRIAIRGRRKNEQIRYFYE